MTGFKRNDDWALLCVYGISAARFARLHAKDILASTGAAAPNTNSTRESIQGLQLLRSRGDVRAGRSCVKATSTVGRQIVEVSLLGTAKALRYVLVVTGVGTWSVEQMELVAS